MHMAKYQACHCGVNVSVSAVSRKCIFWPWSSYKHNDTIHVVVLKSDPWLESPLVGIRDPWRDNPDFIHLSRSLIKFESSMEYVRILYVRVMWMYLYYAEHILITGYYVTVTIHNMILMILPSLYIIVFLVVFSYRPLIKTRGPWYHFQMVLVNVENYTLGIEQICMVRIDDIKIFYNNKHLQTQFRWIMANIYPYTNSDRTKPRLFRSKL